MKTLHDLEWALYEADDAFTKSRLAPFVRYADTVANTKGQLRVGGKAFNQDDLECRILELQAARDYFRKHTTHA